MRFGRKADHEIGPTVPGRDWVVDLGLTAAGLAAIAASYSALKGLAHLTGWGRLDWLLWVAIDIYALTATRVWLSRRTKSKKVRRFAAYNSVGAIGLSLVGNAAYHAIHAKAWNLGGHFWMLVVAVSSVPPAIIGLIGHLAVLRTRDAEFAADESVEAGASQTPNQVRVDGGHDRPHGATIAGATERATTARATVAPTVSGPLDGRGHERATSQGPQEPTTTVAPDVAPRPMAPATRPALAPSSGRARDSEVAPATEASNLYEFAPRGETQAKMRAHWETGITGGLIPSGADLNRAVGKDPKYSLGKKYAKQWRQELPEQFVEAVEAGRTEDAREIAAGFSAAERKEVAQ